jgi:cytochrome c biogenesis protein CcmG/thiol:disulfide interchange protein DsbE
LVPLALFAALAALFALSLKSGDPSRLPSALIGKPAPPLVLPGLEGLVGDRGPVPGIDAGSLADGKSTVVNFWASWCAPCIAEHPLLIELGRRTGVRLVGVNYKDQTAAARRFLGRYGNPFAAVGVDTTGRQAIEWGVYGMPETFVVDGKGRIVHKHVGPITPESLVKTMIPAVEKAQRGS